MKLQDDGHSVKQFLRNIFHSVFLWLLFEADAKADTTLTQYKF
jgi:hypothetical protein